MPYGDVPYPYQSPRASTKKNWMGIVSVVLVTLGGGLLGLVLGIFGALAAKRGEATNKGLAITGAILNVVVPVILIGAFIAANSVWDSHQSAVLPDDLTIGDCIDEPRLADSGELLGVYLTDCDAEHWGQVYELAMIHGSDYGSDADVDAKANALCDTDEAFADVDPIYYERLYITYFLPTRASWAEGDRRVTCFVTDFNNSVRGDWLIY